MKSYTCKTNTNFYDNEMPKVGSDYIFLSIILIDSIFKMGKNYYLFKKNADASSKKGNEVIFLMK